MIVSEEKIKGEMWIILATTALFGYMLWTVGNEQFFEAPKRYQTAPCKTFESLPLNEVPARCVNQQGGFKP